MTMISRLFAIVLPLAALMTASAQQLRLHLVDGKTGKPRAHSWINVWVGKSQITAKPVTADDNGRIEVSVKNDGESGGRLEGLSQTNAVLPDSEFLQIQMGYALCASAVGKTPQFEMTRFAISEAMSTGIVTTNNCGKATVQPVPGEITIFVRKLTWLESFRD